MKQYFVLIRFVLIMGVLTSGIFVGMEVWTKPLIEANASIELKSTILSANNISFTTANVNQIFDQEITVVEEGEFTLYVAKSTGNISYEFNGGGVWGPIIGILTLDADLQTIRQVRVLQQEETPGLGGVVATIPYLSKYEGILMVPALEVNVPDANPNKPNEVDTITGATRTSKAFETMLNESYASILPALEKVGR